ncbi:hypothetical protein LEP1GSC133_3704 [Leptospira borgpetersenii serovar Pomona str. 200901868]|uniref:Uncharacterized protein n=2 Tax=Leptospira borgpetersenii TaxID=174 RepID=M6WC85_LEPBO|nr:hypothetical protein LEP1GSC133_3704 [Leptospira borgpetersenii serovar Pomona str. 200901868]
MPYYIFWKRQKTKNFCNILLHFFKKCNLTLFNQFFRNSNFMIKPALRLRTILNSENPKMIEIKKNLSKIPEFVFRNNLDEFIDS